MKKFFLILILLYINSSQTQDFKHVDSIVVNYPGTFKSIKAFAQKIDADFNTDLDKVRAAYYWISNNISYDYENLKDLVYMKFNKESFANNLYNLDRYKYAENSLRKRKAICAGYSELLKYTLNELDIECEVISGFAKTDIRNIGWTTDKTNHAWNAVYINNKWQLIDATWSTGNDENKPSHFDFDDSYFLIKPEHLIWSHYPKEKKWQLLKTPVTKTAFFYSPLVRPSYYNSGLELSKMSGLVRKNKIIKVVFKNINKDNEYRYQFTQYSLITKPIKFLKKGNSFIAQIPYDIKKGKKLVIWNNHKACLSFKII